MMNKTATTDVALARRLLASSEQGPVAQMPLCVFYSDNQCTLQLCLSEKPLFIKSVGTEAQRILQHSIRGRVLAVFQRSFYVQSDSGIMCVGLASLGQGPLHIQLAADDDLLFQNIVPGLEIEFCNSPQQRSDLQLSGLAGSVGQPSTTKLTGLAGRVVQSSTAKLPRLVGSVVQSSTAVYSGSVLQDAPQPITDQAIQLIQACKAPSSTLGFSWLLSESAWQEGGSLNELATSHLDAMTRAFRLQSFPAIEILLGWLVDSFDAVPSDTFSESTQINKQPCVVNNTNDDELKAYVLALVGSGPGLTPSGDDLLAGVMLVLHRLQYTRLVQSLWRALEPSLAVRTNAISGAHLRMAAQGQCAEPMLTLLNRLMGDGEPDAASDIRAIVHDIDMLATSIGSSSGWDTLAGMSLVVRALSHRKQFVVPLTWPNKRYLSNASN